MIPTPPDDRYVITGFAYDFDDDIEARAFIALHLWEGRRTGVKINSYLAVDGLIQQDGEERILIFP